MDPVQASEGGQWAWGRATYIDALHLHHATAVGTQGLGDECGCLGLTLRTNEGSLGGGGRVARHTRGEVWSLQGYKARIRERAAVSGGWAYQRAKERLRYAHGSGREEE